MKKGLFCVFFIAVLASFFLSAFVLGGDRMIVKANILAPSIKISVPDSIFFGNVTKGFNSDNERFRINNTGTTAISVTPRLENASEKIFSNLYFGINTTAFKKIGNFSFSIDKPKELGGIAYEYVYAMLNLTSYSENIPKDMINHNASVIFYAISS